MIATTRDVSEDNLHSRAQLTDALTHVFNLSLLTTN
jgi:hypothetical protein